MERKFRVWCKNRNEWEKDFVYLTPNGVLLHHGPVLMPLKEEAHIVEFWTGLYDREGKEVFEGDVMGLDKYTAWVVCWHDGGFSIYNQSNPGTYYPLGQGMAETRKVVGTIHDQPELVKEG